MMRACGFGLFAFVAAVGFAQDPNPIGDVSKIPSKGAKGDLVPAPFRAYMVVDNRYPPKVAGSTNPDDRHPKDTTNKMHDLVTEHGLNPVVAVFVRADPAKLGDTGVHKLATELNRLMTIPEYRGNKLAAFLTFLKIEGMLKSEKVKNPDGSEATVELDAEYPDDEKRDIQAKAIGDLANHIKAPNVVYGLAPVTSKAAAAWNLGDKDEVTVVFFNRGRVVDRWTFDAAGPDENQLKAILATVDTSVLGTKKP